MRFTRGVAALREKERRLRGGGGAALALPLFFFKLLDHPSSRRSCAGRLILGDRRTRTFRAENAKNSIFAIMDNSNAHNGLVGELKTRVASASRTFDDHGVGSRSHHQSGPVKEGDRGCFFLRVGETGTGPATDGRREVRTRA